MKIYRQEAARIASEMLIRILDLVDEEMTKMVMSAPLDELQFAEFQAVLYQARLKALVKSGIEQSLMDGCDEDRRIKSPTLPPEEDSPRERDKRQD